MPRKQLTALSVFSGIGGFCEGVRKAGFRVVGAVENDRFAAPNYRQIFPQVPLFDGVVDGVARRVAKGVDGTIGGQIEGQDLSAEAGSQRQPHGIGHRRGEVGVAGGLRPGTGLGQILGPEEADGVDLFTMDRSR